MPHQKKFMFHRVEGRIPMEIPVLIDGHRQAPGSESTFTENVSARGARVVSVRRWEQGESLLFASRTGEFRSSARVAYCQPLQGEGFAIGVEFLVKRLADLKTSAKRFRLFGKLSPRHLHATFFSRSASDTLRRERKGRAGSRQSLCFFLAG